MTVTSRACRPVVWSVDMGREKTSNLIYAYSLGCSLQEEKYQLQVVEAPLIDFSFSFVHSSSHTISQPTEEVEYKWNDDAKIDKSSN